MLFVRSNPNFMYAKKKLYLPSINEIKELVYKNKKKITYDERYRNKSRNIFFWKLNEIFYKFTFFTFY